MDADGARGDESPCRGDHWSPVLFGEMRSHPLPVILERSEGSGRVNPIRFFRPSRFIATLEDDTKDGVALAICAIFGKSNKKPSKNKGHRDAFILARFCCHHSVRRAMITADAPVRRTARCTAQSR